MRLDESDERDPEQVDDLLELSMWTGDLELAGINLGGLEPHWGVDKELNYPESFNGSRFASGFIPLKPGLNVCYGLNGSGKSRLLNVISRLALNKHGPCEGFTWSFTGAFQEAALGTYDTNPMAPGLDLPSVRIRKVSPTRFWFDTAKKPVTVDIADENEEILREFVARGSILLTWPLKCTDRNHYVAVPICARKDVGPVTKRVLDQMAERWEGFQLLYDTFLESQIRDEALQESQNAPPRADPTTYSERNKSKHRERHTVMLGLSAAWIQEFEGSILYDMRNFGDPFWEQVSTATDWWDVRETPDFMNEECPVYLPAIATVGVRQLPVRVSGEGRTSQLDDVDRATRNGLSWELSEGVLERAHASGGTTQKPTDSRDGSEGGSAQTEAEQVALRWSAAATAMLDRVLPGSGPLRCEVGDVLDWLMQREPSWLMAGHPIAAASKAELRWISLVIQTVALGPARLLLIDEPESGLHRRAERAVANALANDNWAGAVIAATHSPMFLDQPGANLLRIDRHGGATPWKPEYYEQHFELGLTKSDMLTNVGLFLLVEGEHERVVLDALFGERLRELGVRVVPMRGGAGVQHVVDSQFLFDCTDATIMALLDNLAADSVRKVWSEARDLAQVGKMDAARDKVLNWGRNDPTIGKRNDERVWLTEFMTAAMTAGEHERVEVHGLAEADLIYYMPPRSFVGGNSWAKIKARYADYTQECEGAKKKPLSLKPWIERTYARDATSPEAFRAAAEEIDRQDLPSDLLGLLAHLEEIYTV